VRKRLDGAKGKWSEELFEVLWAYRCTPQSATNESPFNLVYGIEAMILVEIGEPSLRRQIYDHDVNQQNFEKKRRTSRNNADQNTWRQNKEWQGSTNRSSIHECS